MAKNIHIHINTSSIKTNDIKNPYIGASVVSLGEGFAIKMASGKFYSGPQGIVKFGTIAAASQGLKRLLDTDYSRWVKA